MPERRDLIAMAATIAADSAWLYPALGLLGAVFGLDGPLLPPAMIVAILLLGVILGWVVAGVVEEAAERAPFQALSGLAVVYLAISTIAAEGGIDLLWAPHLIGGVLSAQAMASLIAATTAAGFLWYRGIRIAVETHLQFRLLQTFRTGIVALAVLILVEQAFDVDFSATFMLVPFFAVSLAGLAFARLPSGGAWARTVGLAVAVVIGGGFVVGLIGAVVGGRGLGLLATGWERLVAVIAWLLTVVLAPLLEVLFAIIAWLLSDVERPDLNRSGKGIPDFKSWARTDAEGMAPWADLVIDLVKYPLLLLLIYLGYRLLLLAYRASAQRARAAAAAERESIRGEAEPAADLIKLALGLLPDWLLPAEPLPGPHLPTNRVGLPETHALYFEMLAAAGDHGHHFEPSATPRERLPEVEKAIPGAPVARITECFNAACYGNIAAKPETIDQLRREFEGAVGVR